MKQPRFYEKRPKSRGLLPLDIYKHEFDTPGRIVYAHWHEEAEILSADCAGVITIEGNTYPFRHGDLLFVNPNCLHHVTTSTGGILYALVFGYEYLEFKGKDYCQDYIIEPLKNGTLLFPTVLQKGEKTFDLLRDDLSTIVHYYGSDISGKEMKIKSCLYNILFLLHSTDTLVSIQDPQKISDRDQVSYVKNSILFMEKNLAKPLTVEAIANNISVSKYHYIRTFHEITGFTPIVFLRDLRVQRATEYLLAGSTVTQAAMMCGFNNISYFIRIFRQRYGVSPGQYRR